MSIDKSIQYVEQDGYNNYIKNSDSVTVPRNFKSRANATPTSLAYITKDEAKMLKKMKKGTPHKGPSGVPSYDDFDAQGNYRSGAAMSAAESGKNTSDTLAAGMSGKDVQDIRSSAIAAGAGQRVNPGFFDSKYTVSPLELQLAKQFTKRGDYTGDLARLAMRRTRGGGLLNFIRGGGITGNLIRSLGQKLGFGKTYDQPTYDMSQFNDLGLLTNTINPTYYDDLGNEGILSTEESNTILKDLMPDKDKKKEKESFQIIPSYPSDLSDEFKDLATYAGLNKIQKQGLKAKKGNVMDGLFSVEDALDSIKPFDDKEDPATLEDVKKFYGLEV